MAFSAAARAGAWLLILVGLVGVAQVGPTYAAAALLAAIYAIIGLSLNVLIGYLGQLSLGHQGFVGAGALFTAYVSTEAGWPLPLAVAVGTAVGAAFALIVGIVALRITGLYLSLVTLVFGLTLQSSLFQVPSLTNSGAGEPANRPTMLLSDARFYYVCLAVLVVVLYLDHRLLASKAGRALLTIKENERVAAAFGINVVGYKLLGFVLSGALAGLGGGLLAYRSQQFTGNDFDFTLGLTFVLMTVIGGAGSRSGVIIGSAFVAWLNNYVPNAGWFRTAVGHVAHGDLGNNLQQFGPLLLGAILLLLTLTLRPGGIGQSIRPVMDWLTGRRGSADDLLAGVPHPVEGSGARA